MKGHCGEELETKEWKQGISISCEKAGSKVVSYPNTGFRYAANKVCNICSYSPYRASSQSETK